jgi:hypothetical protein
MTGRWRAARRWAAVAVTLVVVLAGCTGETFIYVKNNTSTAVVVYLKLPGFHADVLHPSRDESSTTSLEETGDYYAVVSPDYDWVNHLRQVKAFIEANIGNATLEKQDQMLEQLKSINIELNAFDSNPLPQHYCSGHVGLGTSVTIEVEDRPGGFLLSCGSSKDVAPGAGGDSQNQEPPNQDNGD